MPPPLAQQLHSLTCTTLLHACRELDACGSCCYPLRDNLFVLLTVAQAGEARVAANTRVEFVRVQAGYLALQARLAAGASNKLSG